MLERVGVGDDPAGEVGEHDADVVGTEVGRGDEAGVRDELEAPGASAAAGALAPLSRTSPSAVSASTRAEAVEGARPVLLAMLEREVVSETRISRRTSPTDPGLRSMSWKCCSCMSSL